MYSSKLMCVDLYERLECADLSSAEEKVCREKNVKVLSIIIGEGFGM